MKNLNIVGWVTFAFMLLLTACSSMTNSTSNGIKENTWYPVGKMLDNQSFEVIVNNHVERVTFLSLDIPDTQLSEQYNLPIQSFIEEQLTRSGEVRLSFDEKRRNENGQLLAIVTLKDGTTLNEQLLEIGYAKVLISEPNILNENTYKQLEQLSKSNSNGIWAFDTETSNEDVSIRERVFSGIHLTVDKDKQFAVIYNYTGEVINLENWVLVSVTGNETHIFEAVTLEPGENLVIYATKDKPLFNSKTVFWGQTLVWSLNEKEVAELYDKKNELMAIWSE